jgi:hypothetical protein
LLLVFYQGQPLAASYSLRQYFGRSLILQPLKKFSKLSAVYDTGSIYILRQELSKWLRSTMATGPLIEVFTFLNIHKIRKGLGSYRIRPSIDFYFEKSKIFNAILCNGTFGNKFTFF